MSDAPTAASDKVLRIGELSRRVGVPVESLRAWERRYGLLEPSRTPGGFRLYGEDDVARVLAMRANLERGLFAAEAARLALAEDVAVERPAIPAPAVDAGSAYAISVHVPSTISKLVTLDSAQRRARGSCRSGRPATARWVIQIGS